MREGTLKRFIPEWLRLKRYVWGKGNNKLPQDILMIIEKDVSSVFDWCMVGVGGEHCNYKDKAIDAENTAEDSNEWEMVAEIWLAFGDAAKA